MSILGNNLLAQYYAQNQYGLYIPTKLGYVTDGLVAMWDGEYNLGNGHSSTTKAWIDCVGGVRLYFTDRNTGAYDWMDKCVHFQGLGRERFERLRQTVSEDTVCTLEISTLYENVFGSNIYRSPANNFAFGCAYIYFPLTSGRQLFDVRTTHFARNANQELIKNIAATCSLVLRGTNTYNDLHAYFNAQEYAYTYNNQNASTFSYDYIGGGTQAGDNGYRGAARVYCARAYNRALTESELTQNYTVDKARFGAVYN